MWTMNSSSWMQVWFVVFGEEDGIVVLLYTSFTTINNWLLLVWEMGILWYGSWIEEGSILNLIPSLMWHHAYLYLHYHIICKYCLVGIGESWIMIELSSSQSQSFHVKNHLFIYGMVKFVVKFSHAYPIQCQLDLFPFVVYELNG